jgi:hypothetical protein
VTTTQQSVLQVEVVIRSPFANVTMPTDRGHDAQRFLTLATVNELVRDQPQNG